MNERERAIEKDLTALESTDAWERIGAEENIRDYARENTAYLLARVRELEAALAKADTVIEGVYKYSNQPAIIKDARDYLNERGGYDRL